MNTVNELNTRMSKVNEFINAVKKEQELAAYKTKLDADPARKAVVLSQKRNEACEEILIEILSRLFVKALPLDEEYGDCNKNKMRAFLMPHGNCCEYIAEAIKKTNSPLLKRMMESAKTMATEHYMEKAKKLNEINIQDLDYHMTEEEDKKIDEISADMELDEVANIIKNNVQKTVLTEIDRAKREQKAQQDLQDELNKDEDMVSESAIQTELAKRRFKNPKIHQPSLFEAILINNSSVFGESVATDLDAAFAETICEYTAHSVAKALKLGNYSAANVKNLANTYLKLANR